MDNNFLADILYPNIKTLPADIEARYPARNLQEGAKVTRFAPSPTGFLHIGNLYGAFTDERLAHTSGGVFYLRIEDTDAKRTVPNGIAIIIETLGKLGVKFDEGAVRFSKSEEEAFFTGDGIGKPLGIVHQAKVGVVTENDGDINLDDIIELTYSVKKPYRENAVFIMSEESYTHLKKQKNYNGRNVWQITNGEPDMLFGYPVYTTTKLDDVESGNKPVLFGNFDFYCIAERGNRIIRRLSERYAEYGQVGFIGTQRVDAKLVIPEAVKSLEIK